MYNLFVASDANSWDGDSQKLSLDRCLRERDGTDSDLAARFGYISANKIAALLRYHCVFAYESICNKDPKFGFLTDVKVLRSEVRIEYEVIPLDRFITASKLNEVRHLPDIKPHELNRTHWSVKKVDLHRKLLAIGIRLPSAPIDIDTHQFDVALSFPGICRYYVKVIAEKISDTIGTDRCFYDENYKAQLARPDLDLLLQDIYRNRSRLIVVFLGHDFRDSEWCGLEFRAVRDIPKTHDLSRVMYVRMDDGDVEGVMSTDGYIDARQYPPEVIAQSILLRIPN